MARGLTALALAASAAAFAAPGSGHAAAGCSRYASATGDDQANGSAAHPFRTVQRLVRSLPNGATGCLAGGSSFSERVVVDHSVVLQASGPGRPVIVGGITINPAATASVIDGLTVRGRGHARAAILVNADGARIVDNRISGTGYRDSNTACVLLAGSRNAVVDGNRIESCTLATRRGLSAPGVFVGSAFRATVTNNLIVHTAGVGIVLGPNAQRTRVVHNLVDGNTGGVLITGNAHTASSYNSVLDNIFSNSGGNNVQAVWTGTVGRGNVVASNCLWRGFAGNIDAPGVGLAGNVATDPRYVDRPRDYTVLAAACLAKQPRIVATHVTALAAFRVSFHVRALAHRVRIVHLALTGVTPGAQITVRCAHGCSASWSAVARGSTLTLPVLTGQWLSVGAAIDIRATKAGYAGAWARVSVVGLPNGLSVAHACVAPSGAAPVSCGAYT